MRYTKIKDNDVANGVGITMSVWTQGCPHHCEGCFNAETWNFEGGDEFTEKNLKYVLENIDGVLELCREFKSMYPNKKIYLWSGYVFEEFNEKQREILKYVDILVDGPFQLQSRNLSLTLRGSLNQRVIDVKKTLENNLLVLSSLNS